MSDSMPRPHEPLGASLRRHLRDPEAAHTPADLYFALVRALREPLLRAHHATEERYRAQGRKRVHYLSAEFLVGRLLRDTLQNLGLYEEARAAVAELGGELADVLEAERDPGLGSGGLGRLAACYLESAASTGVPVFGHGLDYEYGLFRQVLVDGRQSEAPDAWRAKGSPWLVGARGGVREVPLYGRVDARREATRPGGWLDAKVLLGEARELPVAGRGGETVHTLRLYRARAAEPFDMAVFQAGDHLEAARGQVEAERVTKLLYPPESTPAGRELRLVQEYFLVSCAVQDVLEQHLAEGHPLEELPVRAVFQLNDTHPALAIAELLRLLVDEHGLEFGRAAALCRDTFAYTNHTLLPEALERWPRPLLLHVLPRHLRLVEQLNALFLAEVEARWPGDVDRLRRMSIIEEGSPKHVRMAHLAIVSSYAVNGVSALHSDLMRRELVPDFAELWPERFHNVTNGISHRRWLLGANPGLARLVTERIGEGWVADLGGLRELEAAADDAAFGEAFLAVKRDNKAALAAGLEGGAFLDVDGLFDVQVKRIHEYKRQSLAALYAVHLYLRLVEDGWRPPCARTMLFAGKAAPDYHMAKEILAFLARLSEVVNRDGRTADALRLHFLPDYRVSLAERVIPAADLSEQLSTAGLEASGTGNMKLSLNGALTIGTLDGATIEILEAVGAEQMYVFGHTAEQLAALRAPGAYDPRRMYEERPRTRRVLDALVDGRFDRHGGGPGHSLLAALLDHGDPFFVLADLEAYLDAQERAAEDYLDRRAWARRAVLTVARMGRFSSDRSVREYAERIWRA